MNPIQIRERLSRIDGSKLERLLGQRSDFPWADMVWLLQFPAWLGAAIHIARLALSAKEGDQGPPPLELAWGLVLVATAVLCKFCAPLLRSRQQRVQAKVRKAGAIVPAVIVQANSAYYDDDNDQPWPASVLISFDPQAVGQPDRLDAAAAAVAKLKSQDRRSLPAAQAELAWDLYHEMGPLPSLPVPPELAQGLRDCWMVSAMLPAKALEVAGSLWALAVPGERSPDAVAILPAAVGDP